MDDTTATVPLAPVRFLEFRETFMMRVTINVQI